MTHAENVPVKMNGIDVGRARVDDTGLIQIRLNPPSYVGHTLLEFLRQGVVVGLSLSALVNPAVEGVLRSSKNIVYDEDNKPAS